MGGWERGFGVRLVCAVEVFLILALLGGVPCFAQPVPADLPEAEKKLVDTTDPWGSAFGDQLAIHRGYFSGRPEAVMAVGYTHSLVKIWPNKYWFHGTEVFTGAENAVKAPIWGVTGGTVSFQVAVMPKMGAEAGEYKVKAEAAGGVGVKVYREEFVDVGAAAYPRMETNVWPDPLVEADTCALEGTDAGVFLIEMSVPRDFKGKEFTCQVVVEKAGGPKVVIRVPVRVVKLTLEAAPFPLVAMFNKGRVGDGDYGASVDLLLKHHLQPLDPGHLIGEVWKKEGVAGLEKEVRSRMARGQTVFYTSERDEKLYAFLKEKGWVGHFITQVGPDEPNAATFVGQNIPDVKAFREKFPGLRVLLASMGHARMEEGCDIHLNDLSTTTYDPRKGKPGEPGKGPEMWHYYCHLPIQAEYRAPVVQAPNMMIDNPALEQRLAMWMSWHYGAKGVFIWAGNEELTAKDFWKNKPLKVVQDKATFPYGGVHHGNGFLVYPPREKGGAVVPSLRLKMLRDGMEDVAIFEAIKKKVGGKAEWLSPVPEVFVHPHYFDQLPEGLLGKREAVLKAFAELEGK